METLALIIGVVVAVFVATTLNNESWKKQMRESTFFTQAECDARKKPHETCVAMWRATAK